jgi:hypothetical protein
MMGILCEHLRRYLFQKLCTNDRRYLNWFIPLFRKLELIQEELVRLSALQGQRR